MNALYEFYTLSRRVILSLIITAIANICFLSFQAMAAGIDNVYNRDLGCDFIEFFGHAGIESSDDLIYGMPSDEVVRKSWGVGRELRYELDMNYTLTAVYRRPAGYVEKTSLKLSMINFPSVSEYLGLSFSEKIKLIEDLYQNPKLIRYQENLINLIEQEDSKDLKKELMLLLYSAWSSKGQASLTDEQLSTRLSLFYQLLQSEVTRELAVQLNVGRILKHSQIKEMLTTHGHLFSKKQRETIINAYINNSILNGSDPFSDPLLGDEVIEILKPSGVPKRVQSLLTTWSGLTHINDLSDLNTESPRVS